MSWFQYKLSSAETKFAETVTRFSAGMRKSAPFDFLVLLSPSREALVKAPRKSKSKN